MNFLILYQIKEHCSKQNNFWGDWKDFTLMKAQWNSVKNILYIVAGEILDFLTDKKIKFNSWKQCNLLLSVVILFVQLTS